MANENSINGKCINKVVNTKYKQINKGINK